MKKSALASVKSDRWRHLAPKYQTFGSIRVLKTGRFNFFSLHHYPQHKCGETLSPRCNGCVSMIQWWWSRSSLSESRQPMEVKLEQLLRLQTTEGKRWNIETNLELSLISGPLNSVIAQTLWKSSVDLEYIYWDTATISCFWLLQYLKRYFTTLCIERGSFHRAIYQIATITRLKPFPAVSFLTHRQVPINQLFLSHHSSKQWLALYRLLLETTAQNTLRLQGRGTYYFRERRGWRVTATRIKMGRVLGKRSSSVWLQMLGPMCRRYCKMVNALLDLGEPSKVKNWRNVEKLHIFLTPPPGIESMEFP